MTIKTLCKEAHKLAVEKGFWGIQLPQCKTVRNKSELLMLVVTELAEACEALRHNHRQHYKKNCKTPGLCRACTRTTEEWHKDTFEDELADAVIRICDLAESEGIDLEWQIKKKLEYNKSRPSKHGKEF